MSDVKDLIAIKLYKELEDVLKKEVKKPKPWYDMQLTPSQLIRAYILMILAYPFLGPLVKWAVLKMW